MNGARGRGNAYDHRWSRSATGRGDSRELSLDELDAVAGGTARPIPPELLRKVTSMSPGGHAAAAVAPPAVAPAGHVPTPADPGGAAGHVVVAPAEVAPMPYVAPVPYVAPPPPPPVIVAPEPSALQQIGGVVQLGSQLVGLGSGVSNLFGGLGGGGLFDIFGD